MRKYKKHIMKCMVSLCAASASMIAAEAYAASIINIDDKPHHVVINVLERYSEVTLKPNERYESQLYPMRVSVDGSAETTLEPGAGYAIWSGGVLAKQRRSRGYVTHD